MRYWEEKPNFSSQKCVYRAKKGGGDRHKYLFAGSNFPTQTRK
ncbi:hypothetical protein C1G87_1473 [Dehalococcoides mccartyi]|uniref:Uncharacterized protein n=1 Tax=Dehalococcoides mccartyi TaxID=61435 RepID=A0A328ENF4_9CHLR|nr:hypothetical protein C1G87_1473 [Dehalococcoides mccartyi]